MTLKMGWLGGRGVYGLFKRFVRGLSLNIVHSRPFRRRVAFGLNGVRGRGERPSFGCHA